jgi:hypothetical protein
MATTDLFQHLRELETETHRIETRRNRGRLSELLHPEFVEFARSGQPYERAAVLDEFSTGAELPPVHAQDFELTEVGPEAALLTYRSAHIDSAGRLHRCTLRSSLWIRTLAGWRLRFHQGTPTANFSRAGDERTPSTRYPKTKKTSRRAAHSTSKRPSR